MEDITPKQKDQLKSWSIERDSLLNEISILRDEKSKLINENNEISESSSEIIKNLNIVLGRIEELEKKEKESSERITIENSNNLIKKTKLETEITALESDIKELKEKKDTLVGFISVLEKQKSDKEAGIKLIEDIVNNVVTISNKNMAILDQHSSVLVEKMKEVISLSTQNIEKHNVILTKIPELFVELRRKSLERDEIKKIKHN